MGKQFEIQLTLIGDPMQGLTKAKKIAEALNENLVVKLEKDEKATIR